MNGGPVWACRVWFLLAEFTAEGMPSEILCSFLINTQPAPGHEAPRSPPFQPAIKSLVTELGGHRLGAGALEKSPARATLIKQGAELLDMLLQIQK